MVPPTLCKVDAIVFGHEKPGVVAVELGERGLGFHECVYKDKEST